MDDMNTIWRYGGQALRLDLLDAGALSRYMAAVAALDAAEGAAREAGGTLMAGFCARLRAFFDALFGPGVGERLIEPEDDTRAALMCYADFLAFGRAQAEGILKIGEAARAKYGLERLHPCER